MAQQWRAGQQSQVLSQYLRRSSRVAAQWAQRCQFMTQTPDRLCLEVMRAEVDGLCQAPKQIWPMARP